MSNLLPLVQTAAELGLISGLTVLALFLSYSMLGVCDLGKDGKAVLKSRSRAIRGRSIQRAYSMREHTKAAPFQDWL